jgi:choline dehydrogenase-like flavoprotein
VAALSRAKDGRPACSYSNLEFYQNAPFVYTPAVTLDRLVEQDLVAYRNRFMVDSWSESPGGVRVNGFDLADKGDTGFRARKLILAAGTINTARIVLKSRNDFDTRLRLLDNWAVQIPLVMPSALGQALETHTFGLVQLNLVWESKAYEACLQGSILELSAVSRAVLFEKLPFSARANLSLVRYFLPALLAMQFQFPSSAGVASAISLLRTGKLQIKGHPNDVDLSGLSELLKVLRKVGVWSHHALCVPAPTGLAMHYAGTLPMQSSPKDYACDVSGRLESTRDVFVADASVFPALPAKNASFTIMANAMRTANRVAAELRDAR